MLLAFSFQKKDLCQYALFRHFLQLKCIQKKNIYTPNSIWLGQFSATFFFQNTHQNKVNFISFNRISFKYFFIYKLFSFFLIDHYVLHIVKSQILESLIFFWIHLFFYDLFFSPLQCSITVFMILFLT